MRRALYFDGQQLKLSHQPAPGRAEDEVLIRPSLMGICSTDLHLMSGYKSFTGILGHEFVGEVVEGPAEWMHKRVVGEINIGCMNCDFCRSGVVEHCRDRKTLGISGDYDGAFAEVFRLPVRNLHQVPDGLSDRAAVFTEPLAAACEIMQQVNFVAGAKTAVVGVGKLGLLVLQVLNAHGIETCGIVRHPHQASLLAKWDIPAFELDRIEPASVDVVVDCTGQGSGFDDALKLVKPRGTLVLKSTYHGMTSANLTQVVVNEITLVGSRCGPFDKALQLLDRGLIDTQSLIEEVFSLEDYDEAFDRARQPGTLKLMLQAAC